MMSIRSGVLLLTCVLGANLVYAEEQRRIEEMVVTAEKRQSTVSDTSISITAFSGMMLEEQGIQNANEFVNFIPATTRDDYDIRIRGVGRNFRSLGGDPGVATYYNGIYSEDALIALTENGLWDVERIEVLRGPQGTLYGRNSIGGAINYISKKPTEEFEGELRTQVGKDNNLEVYGVLSGPITDTLGYRFTGAKRTRDGWQEGQFGTQDVDSTDSQNFALSLQWKPTDTLSFHTRFNDRRSLRRIGTGMILNEGWGSRRGTRSTDLYAYGIRDVTANPTAAGAEMFTHPTTGEVRFGAPNRPGVDVAPSFPNSEYMGRGYLNDDDVDDLEPEAYTNGLNNEEFDQQAVSFEAVWDRDNFSVKYLFGYSDFLYTFDTDGGFSNSQISDPGARTHEEIYNYSHELTLTWDVNENFDLTAGVYNFYSNRLQDFSFQNLFSQGRLGQNVDYGAMDAPNLLLGGASVLQASGIGPAVSLGDAPVGTTISGRWDGSFDSRGSTYRHKNINETTQVAAYTQGTYRFSEEFALTLGVRWAEDEKEVVENRGGYFELDFVEPFRGLYLFDPASGGFNNVFEVLAQTSLSLQNVLMGNATPTADPANPIVPVCDLTAPSCSNPLRLGGVPLSFTGRGEDDDTWDDVTWRANLDWTPNEDNLVYFSVTTGYRAGGYALGLLDARLDTVSGQKPLTYEEETVMAYEIGYKGTLFDGTVQLNSSIYRYDYEGYQDEVDVFDSVQNEFRSIATNTGDAVNQGFEVEITWLATDALTLNMNYSFTDTEYQDNVQLRIDDNPLAPVPLYGEVPVNIKGNQLKGIPEQKATVWGTYEWMTDIGKFVAAGSVAYTGEYYPTGIERGFDEIPDRTRVDTSISWYSTDESIRARLFVDNVFDESMVRGIGTGSHSNNYRYTASLLEGRYYGLDLRWQFGG